MTDSTKKKTKIIFKNHQSPGDIIAMTSVPRDIHKSCPNEFEIDVRTSCPEMWENNPYLTKLDERDPEVTIHKLGYSLINRSNQGPYKFCGAFTHDAGKLIGRELLCQTAQGDIHLSDPEKVWVGHVKQITEDDRPYWIVDAGWKSDYTAKAWPTHYFQEMVDMLVGKIQFVQIGHESHNHPKLKNVINLIGKTDLRQLVRLFYWSQGVVTPVSLPMMMANAVECYNKMKYRPCVVIGGGREPSGWQAFTTHQFIHCNGTMDCCEEGGCWKSRVVPLRDRQKHDTSLCSHPIKFQDGSYFPKCMVDITPEEVVKRINMYFNHSKMVYLDEAGFEHFSYNC